MRELTGELELLRAPLERNGSTVKVFHVDNCCSVRNALKRTFGEALLVKLDICHWLARWSEIPQEPHSEESATFRGLMSGALLTCDNEECKRAKEVVGKRVHRIPSHKEAMREANTRVPEPGALRSNVVAVL